MITAPYNFVPLNKQVFFPPWTEDVNHDIPFEDGESGVIDITITAKSPIFIRDHEKPEEFCQHNGHYYIPGSSVKGMVRNVLEIMSFSKITIDEVKLKKPLSVRDMTNRKELVGTANGCGFLVKNGDNYCIEDCGNIVKIRHSKLRSRYPSINNKESAKEKYETFGFQQEEDGMLVFTGNIGNKKHEFIFKRNGDTIDVSSDVADNFKKVYFENEDSIDGQFWKQKFKNENAKIPVFYIKKNDNIKAIGLTQLFKLAYNKTLFEAAQQKSNNNKLDLAETIFGTHKERLTLKGRVQFSHYKADKVYFEREIEQVLGTPNPTYYPNYIRQTDLKGNKINKYKTLMDKDAEISGWKRYPLQPDTQQYNLPQNGEGQTNHDVTTKFTPLGKGTSFHGKIRFHNLKKAEIGALLSALTFHGNCNCMHNIGMAKPLGYGKINIHLNLKNLKFTQNDYRDSFQKLMDSWDKKEYANWLESSQITELLSMSNANNKKTLKYQQLENQNDFVNAKKAKEFLLPFSYEQQKVAKKNINTPIKNKPQNGYQLKEYSISEIAKEVNTTVDAVLDFIQKSTLPISKKLNQNSSLKEAQAIELIKKMKKQNNYVHP